MAVITGAASGVWKNCQVGSGTRGRMASNSPSWISFRTVLALMGAPS